jgi:hypothetical protein
LLQTSRTGAANIAAVTGEDFSTLVSQWQLANYLDNLSGFTPASDRLQYLSVNLRSVYQLNYDNGVFAKPYPLTPDVADAGSYQASGVLRGGSGRHVRILRAAGSGEIDFRLTDGGGSAAVTTTVKPRIALARVR